MDYEIKTTLIEAYNRYARDRDSRELHPWKIQERDRFLALLKQEHKKTILEIGAGTGKISRFFKDNGFKVIATDMSSEMVRLCREKQLPACVMDFCSIGFSQENFDAVWALNCLIHVPRKELPEVLRGIRDVLKPKGLFYMGVYGGTDFEGMWEDDYYRPKRFFSFYPDRQIQEIVARLFQILYFRGINVGEGKDHFQSMILRKTE
jgi:SAM-dependent methyltransferase